MHTRQYRVTIICLLWPSRPLCFFTFIVDLELGALFPDRALDLLRRQPNRARERMYEVRRRRENATRALRPLPRDDALSFVRLLLLLGRGVAVGSFTLFFRLLGIAYGLHGLELH